MCSPESETKAISKRPRQEPQHHDMSTIMKPTRRQHLITDDGFGRHLTINLLLISIVITICSINETAHTFALDKYHLIKEQMMQFAGEMAWWSALALLSSSCCAIQIILNAVSFGCAGFNTVLGPLRPTFVAVTIVAQLSSWYVALYSSRVNNQWRVTLGSTFVSGILTLLPEFLAWQTAKRERLIRRQHHQRRLLHIESASLKNCGNSSESDSRSGTGTTTTIQLQFQLSTMGCSSCVSTVSKVLAGIDGVLRHSVSLEDGTAEIALDEAFLIYKHRTEKNTTKIEDDISTISEEYLSSSVICDLLWNDIADRLEAAGFPVDNTSTTTSCESNVMIMKKEQ